MSVLISSVRNPRVKKIAKLGNRRHREIQQQTAVEGIREIKHALENGVVPQEAYLCPELLAGEAEGAALRARLEALADTGETELFTVTTAVFERLAYRGNSGGLLLLIPIRPLLLEDLPLGLPPFLVVVEAGEKPGNLGAVLRTADAAGVDGLIISESEDQTGTDVYNPNVIRASLGALFTVPVAQANTPQVIAWLKQQQIQIVAAAPDGDRGYTAVDLTGPIAVVTGSEAYGLSDPWLQAADHRVRIPMHGSVDSLNLSIATALLLYEGVRQRHTSASIHPQN